MAEEFGQDPQQEEKLFDDQDSGRSWQDRFFIWLNKPAFGPVKWAHVVIVTSAIVVLRPLALMVAERIIWTMRYNHAVKDMQMIAEAAKADYARNKNYAPEVNPGILPARFTTLAQWPAAPCEGWAYGWDDWVGVPGAEDTVRVSLRDKDWYTVYYVCIQSNSNCAPAQLFGNGKPVEKAPHHYLTCKERGG